MDAPISGRAQRTEPAVNLEAGAERSPGYATAFTVQVPDAVADTRSVQEWARHILEDAPQVLKWLVFIGWKFVLRLRLAPRGTPGTVAGWTITETTPDSITLGVNSSLVAARKVLNVGANRLTLTTHVRYEHPAGRVLWAVIAPIHHRIEPLLLTLAASRSVTARAGGQR